ncbi:MAG: YdeI family protein [Bacteroidota bacterium]
MNELVDKYLIDGCMRCKFGGTPECKVNDWREELKALRSIVLDCGLSEELKWGVPCYAYGDSNVSIVSAFKDYASLSFFKGVLLKDPEGILVKPGENSQSVRYLKFTSTKQILELESVIRSYIYEAIEVDRLGLKVEFKKNPEPIPEELQARLDEDPALQAAFDSLTPGRQRSYIIHVSQPKQAATRISRMEKCIPKIMEGKGFFDR